MKSWRGVRIYTIGHSTRTVAELAELLRAFDVSVLADIRAFPRSRANPQFDRGRLRSALHRRRIRYVHLPELGGRRRARKDSPNTGWHNAGFRGFADYMSTPEFDAGLKGLRELATDGKVALMCAEALPWRCHRSLVADALTARGARVEHITSATRSMPHRLTRFARLDDSHVTYPDPEGWPLETPTPFHLEATVRVLQRRPANRVDVWEDVKYLRVLRTTGGLALVQVTNFGSIDEPDLRFLLLHGAISAGTRSALERILRSMLGLDVDPAPLQRAAQSERWLRSTALALRGMRPPRYADLFEAFANVVPFQQVSLDSGVAIVGRLVERFGPSLEHEGRRCNAFPEASVIAGARLDRLRACGLSRRKAETLRRIARSIDSGDLGEEQLSRMSSAEAVRFLTALPGIGPWSAALVLLRGLGRLDVFPPDDAGAARGLGTLMHRRSRSSLDRVIRRFGEHRGYLYFCSLGAGLLAKGLVHAAPPPRARN